MKNQKYKNIQQREFPDGHPLQYYFAGLQLRMVERTGYLSLKPMAVCAENTINAASNILVVCIPFARPKGTSLLSYSIYMS